MTESVIHKDRVLTRFFFIYDLIFFAYGSVQLYAGVHFFFTLGFFPKVAVL